MKRGTTYTKLLPISGRDLTAASEVVVSVKPRGKAPLEFDREHISISSDGTDSVIAFRLSEEQSLSIEYGSYMVDVNWVLNGIREGVKNIAEMQVSPTLLNRLMGGADGDPDPDAPEPETPPTLTAEDVRVLNAISPKIVSVTHSGTNTVVVINDINGDHTVSIPDGQDGSDGVGIASVVLNSDYTLTINYTNGQSTTTTSIRGATGATGADGQDGADGVSPTVSVTDITGGHRITITDAEGQHTFDVLNGEDGTDGTDGSDGYSPTVTVTDITGGHRLTITDKNGTQTVDVLNGTNGQDGTDAYVYIRYSASEPTQDSDMKTTPDAWMGIYSGDAATAPTAYTAYTWYKIKGETGAAGVVQDVQVNGTSVVTSGVANITPSDLSFTTQVTGTTPTITALSGIQYVCGEVATLDITLPASGIVDVVFESGSTPTVLTITPPTGVTEVKWADGWDGVCEADTTYELKIMDGEYGVVTTWSASPNDGTEKWELIEEITLTEATSTVSRDFSIGYKKLLVITDQLSSAFSTWNNFSTRKKVNGELYRCALLFNSETHYTRIFIEGISGTVGTLQAQSKSITYATVQYNPADNNFIVEENAFPIWGFQWTYESNGWPAGAKIYVYGIRV